MVNSIRTDIEFLLACLAAGDPWERQARLETIIAAGVDWDQFTTLVAQHEVAPAVYKALRDSKITDLPPSCLNNLRAQFHQAGLESYRLLDALLAILDLLHANQIAAIPYKGPVLSAMLYGDPTMRACQDIDILVRAGDAPRALALLQQGGYQPVESAIDPAENHHQPLAHARTGIVVEMHWDVVSRKHGYTLSTADFWQRLQPVVVNGKSVLTFAPDDMLLLLCVHGAKHYWRSAKWMVDVARLVGTSAIDWPGVLNEAQRLRIENQLALGLLMAQRYLNSQLPPTVTAYLRQKYLMRWLAAIHEGQLAGRSELYPFIEGGLTEWLVHRSPKTGWRLIRRFFQQRLRPNEQDQAVLHLRGPFRVLYMVIRPVRLFLTYGLPDRYRSHDA
ncbi:MAG: nucleotidyltransferase family protein [Anaerolineae bacterium]|nr:nucleotidyltransferase family protein [Anaerolineae bacterium]